ncbi:MAG: hypothetical protein PHD97_02895 [Bacteroidales bacterium]|nr:hypothetical protein [Bacteroidales bacterium]
MKTIQSNITRFTILVLSICFFAIILFANQSYGQNNCAAFKANEATWYGIDFTRAKMVGPDFNDPQAIRDQFFKSWNDLILKEFKKFDLRKFFRKGNVPFNIEPVISRNSKVNISKLTTYNSGDAVIKETELKDIIKEYDIKNKEGVGMLLVVESFNNIDKTGYFHIVFFDLATKSVLFTQKISGKAAGVGFRNFWAGAIYNALKLCERDYPNWEKEACGNK